jgi:hypothetical protein
VGVFVCDFLDPPKVRGITMKRDKRKKSDFFMKCSPNKGVFKILKKLRIFSKEKRDG